MTETRAALLVRLSPGLKSRLVEIAKRERRSLSKQVEFMLERCLDSVIQGENYIGGRSPEHPTRGAIIKKKAR
jgi:hypothetical protein